MNPSEHYSALMLLKKYKLKEFQTALAQYSVPDQDVITFDEVNRIKDEIDELTMLMRAIEKLHKESLPKEAPN